MSTADLVTVEPLLPMDPEVARTAMAKYQELTAAMLKPDDWQVIPSGRFVKRSGFQKIASGYGVSTEIVTEQLDRDDKGQPIRAHAVVRATHPNGRFADGSGRCSIDESRFKTPGGRAKAENDISGTAATRATNRAISNLVGFGQVSAEEVDGAGPTTSAALPYGPEGTAESDAKVAAIVDRLYPDVPGDQFVALVNHQLGTAHLPDVSARMVHAIDWALGDERMRRAPEPENAPPPAGESAYTEAAS
jgi:hypothetical protein